MDEPIVTVLVNQPPAEVCGFITSLFIARIDRLQLAALVSDCADEAHRLSHWENERMFRLAELILGGGTLGTPETAQQCTNQVALVLAAYRAQKSVNGHRALPPLDRTSGEDLGQTSALAVLAADPPQFPTPAHPAEDPGQSPETLVHVGAPSAPLAPDLLPTTSPANQADLPNEPNEP